MAIVMPIAGKAASIPPQTPPSWKNVKVNNAKIAVLCFFMDSHGIMWLGTKGGLYFYDGISTHRVGKDELDTEIYTICEKDNHLYIGGNSGLYTYDFKTGRINKNQTSTLSEIRTSILLDEELWIGGLNGIEKMNLRSGKVVRHDRGLQSKSVYSLIRDSRGIIYAGTYRGLARWNPKTEEFKAMHINMPNAKLNSTPFINCLLETTDSNSLLVGGNGILYKYTVLNDNWEEISLGDDCNVKSICNGPSGKIYVGTEIGVFELMPDSIKHYRHNSTLDLSIADNEIWCIYSDSNNILWAGHERGFSLVSNTDLIRTINHAILTHSVEGNEFHTIFRDSKNRLWLGGTNGLISLHNDGVPQWYRHNNSPNSISHNRVRDILEDKNHQLWFATDAGINKFDEEHNGFHVYNLTDISGKNKADWVYALEEDGDSLWIGSFLGGLHKISKSKFVPGIKQITTDFFLRRSGNKLINNVIKDRNGQLWVLSFRDDTLKCYKPSDSKIQKYNIFKITNHHPTHIDIDKAGRIWCAFNGGVVIFENGGKHYVVKFPFTNSDESVLSMGSVKDGMWISTQSNVWMVGGESKKATLLPISQRQYTSIYEDSMSGKIYLGGVDEILEVDSRIICQNHSNDDIKIILTSKSRVELLGYNDSENEGYELPYGDGISLTISSLRYSPYYTNRYMYKLSENSADTITGWVVLPEGVNTISFSDLKMGNYHLLVKTVGSPDSPTSIPIKVNPPIYLSWWAIVIYVIIIFCIVYWIVWYVKRKNDRLFQEKERQAALDNAEKKLTFLSNISHDLKTPLSMIMGPVSLMKERVNDPETKKGLDTVYDNAVRLNNLIHRTLELRHIEDIDENLLITSIFDIVEFCKGIFDVFKENKPQKRFIIHAPSSPILIEADAVKLESVITNLLSNSCKYSDDGATISMGISKRDNEVEIVVSDDGIGISEAEQPLVFQRLFRSKHASKVKEGTGIGLYLIKKYLDLMNGKIDLFSKEGQGTSFVLTLPISGKVISKHTEHGKDENPECPKILIIEDNAQISNFISKVLAENYNCLTAENGRAGLSVAVSFLPDLIIVDEMMPIMSGLEMVGRLKKNPRLSYIPIIMLTAKADNVTENESIKLGIDTFMTKPFDPATLRSRVEHLLKSRSEIKEKMRIQTIAEAEVKPIEAESSNEKVLANIAKIVEENISDPDLNVNLLCEKSGINQKQLYRLIKKFLGITPLDYIRRVRLQKAALLISQQRFSISEISYMVGFKTPSYFAKCFQSQFGVKPSQYQSDDMPVDNR